MSETHKSSRVDCQKIPSPEYVDQEKFRQYLFKTVRHGSSLANTELRPHCESTPELLSKGPGFVLYAVMDSIVDQYFPVIKTLEGELISVKEKIFGEKPKNNRTHLWIGERTA